MHLDQLPGSFFGPANLVDLLRHRAEHQAQMRGFVYLRDGESDEISVSYAELDQQARAIAAELTQKNLAGQRALLLYPTGLEFIAAFFGCMYAGVVAVTAYPPRRNRNMHRIEAIAEDAEAAIALTTRESLDRVRGFIQETPKLVQIEWLATDEIPDTQADAWEMPDVHGDSLALLQYTSGSTGTPKGVVLTHANLMHNSAMIAYAFENTRSGAGMFWLPSYHDMGLVGGVLQPLYIGQRNVIFSPAAFLQKPFRWLDVISRYGATISGGPNFAYDLCVEKITDAQVATLDLSRWSLAFNGAEPVRSETIDRFSEKFAPAGFRREAFYPCFGLAEATLIVTGGLKTQPPIVRCFDAEALENHEIVEALRDEEGTRDLVGSGGNLLDQRIVIVDPDTLTPCAANRVGEIWVAGPSVSEGYWNRPEESRETFQAYLRDTGEGPFLRTGDLGFMVAGELFVTGRRKDLIIIRGVNHYPQDIEQTVEKCDPQLRVNAGAAFTVGPEGRERLAIVQEVRRTLDLDPESVITAIRRQIAVDHELPLEEIALIKAGSIPKTSSGKIQRHACKAALADETLAFVARWRAAEGVDTAPTSRRRRSQKTVAEQARETAEVVYEQVRRIAGNRAVDLQPDTNIVDLGLDSLERLEIVAALEEAFGGRFPEEVVAEMETCDEVVAAVEKYLGDEQVRQRPATSHEGEIPQAWYDVAQFPEYRQLQQTADRLQAAGLANPYFQVHEGITSDTTQIEGRQLVNFSSYNYLGMSGEPRVIEAAKAAVDRYGTSVSASRLVSGEKTIHRELEQAIADFIGAEDAICLVGGHATNETTIGHLFGPGDLILHDALAHNSILQGCILSGARRRSFPHNDVDACGALLDELRRDFRRVLIVVEGVYSMDGDYADIPRFLELKERHKAFLMVDEAHSIGTMGPHGRGMAEFFDLDARKVDLWMGTLSKSMGSCGGYIAAREEVVEYLKYTAPGFVYSVGMAPANAAAALKSLELLEEEPQRVEQLQKNSAQFLSLARAAGLNTGLSNSTPVIPVIVGSSPKALALSHRLFARGINVQPILYPAVEESAARLRFFITSDHTSEQIECAVAAVAEELGAIQSEAKAVATVSAANGNGR